MMGKPASMGAMGVHYFRPDLLGVTAPPSPRVNGVGTHRISGRRPFSLYEPSRRIAGTRGGREPGLDKAWKAAGHKAPPTFQGVP